MNCPVVINFIIHKDIESGRDQFVRELKLGKGLAQVLMAAGMIICSV